MPQSLHCRQLMVLLDKYGRQMVSGQLSVATVPTAGIADLAVTNAKVADDAVGVAELSATGTASATTYLRGGQ